MVFFLSNSSTHAFVHIYAARDTRQCHATNKEKHMHAKSRLLLYNKMFDPSHSAVTKNNNHQYACMQRKVVRRSPFFPCFLNLVILLLELVSCCFQKNKANFLVSMKRYDFVKSVNHDWFGQVHNILQRVTHATQLEPYPRKNTCLSSTTVTKCQRFTHRLSKLLKLGMGTRSSKRKNSHCLVHNNHRRLSK